MMNIHLNHLRHYSYRFDAYSVHVSLDRILYSKDESITTTARAITDCEYLVLRLSKGIVYQMSLLGY